MLQMNNYVGGYLTNHLSSCPCIITEHKSPTTMEKALVEAAKGEPARKSLGISYGKSFSSYHPVYHEYYIPYKADLKTPPSAWVSPMVVDWPRYWRHSGQYSTLDLKECISAMNSNPDFSVYYDNAIRFAKFSEAHEDWIEEVSPDGLSAMDEYYEKVDAWLDGLE